MKVVVFNDEKEIVEIMEFLEDVKSLGLDEVSWRFGGMASISENYVILEDDEFFENITDDEILRQYKEQVLYTMAKEIERNRIDFMVYGSLSDVMNDFEEKKPIVKNATTREEVEVILIEFRNDHF